MIGPAPMKSRGPIRSDSAPKRFASRKVITVSGRKAAPAASASVAGDLLDEQAEDEHHPAEPRVHRQRREVADREVARAEQPEVEHRLGRAPLVEDEQEAAGDPAEP